MTILIKTKPARSFFPSMSKNVWFFWLTVVHITRNHLKSTVRHNMRQTGTHRNVTFFFSLKLKMTTFFSLVSLSIDFLPRLHFFIAAIL